MSSVHELCQVVNTMQREMEQWFEYITNPQTTNFDPLFVMCTFLNPGYRDILNNEEVAAAKSHLINGWLYHLHTSSHKEKQLKKYNLLWQMKKNLSKKI